MGTPTVIRLLGLASGGTTSFDGRFLSAYDPLIPGEDPDGRQMQATVEAVDDPDEAIHFDDMEAAWRCWSTLGNPPWRPDGKPNRPLTAFTVDMLSLDEARKEVDR